MSPKSRGPARPRSRAAAHGEVLNAGRVLSTAAVMFHSVLAHKQGLSASDEKAMDLLDRFGPLTAGELGSRTGLAPASVTGLIDRLEKKGFVRRSRDKLDGRRVLIELDRERTAALGPLFDDLVREMNELCAGYSVEQLGLIADFMLKAAARQQAATNRLDAAASTSGPSEPR